MARRNDMEICHDILKVTQGGARKTRIVYRANLNFKIVKKYLQRLLEGDLIEYREDVSRYFTTERGNYWMTSYSYIVSPMKLIISPDLSDIPQPQD